MITQRMPNGTICVIMTPREATMISDEILHPDQYPWQLSENQMTAMDLKHQLREAVAAENMSQLQNATGQLVMSLQKQQAAEKMKVKMYDMEHGHEPEQEPEYGDSDD